MSIRTMLRHRVTVQRSTVTRDAMLGEVPTWNNLYVNIRMDIQPISARELALYGRDTELVSHHGYTQQKGIHNGHRVSFKGRLFDVESVRNTDEQDRLFVVDMLETN